MEALSPRSINLPSKPKPIITKKPTAREIPAQKRPSQRNHAPPPPPHVTEPGHDGEQYETGAFLGKGGFAICYEGRLVRNNRIFAMKVVKSEMSQKKMEEKFRTELQIHSKMRHPNIVTFYRAFSFETNTYVILELCQNGSVMEMVQKRKCLSLPEVRRFMVQLCGAIKYLHKRNVAHRDLKIGNLFLDQGMNIKVGDFGLAAVVLSEKDEKRRKTLCGTPNYIAPEVLDKSKKGHNQKVDIWSLGVILFAILTGYPPFQSKTQEEIYKKVRSLAYTWPRESECANYIPDEAKDLVSACLSLDEDERPEPDEIVDHEFFNMYSGCIPRELGPECRHSLPHWIQKQNPQGDRPAPGYGLEYDSKYITKISHVRNAEERYLICKNDFYLECGVGRMTSGEMRKPSGKRCSKSVYAECLTEEEMGLQPLMPLPTDRIYSYYIDNGRDWSITEVEQKIDTRYPPADNEDDEEDETRTTRNSSLRMQAAALARTELALAAQMRHKQSQPKNHAAMLRQQAIAPKQALSDNKVRNTQQNTRREDATREHAEAQVPSSRNLLVERPIRTRGQTAAAYHSLRERSTAATTTLPKSISAPTDLASSQRRQVTISSRRNLAQVPEKGTTISTREEKGRRDYYPPLSIRSAKAERHEPASQNPTRNVVGTSVSQQTTTKPQTRGRTEAAPKSASSVSSSGKSRSTFGTNPLIHLDDEPDIMPGTSVKEVMEDLSVYLSAIQQQSNYSHRNVRSRRRLAPPGTQYTPHTYVVKWVDYTNRYGIGYVLDEGSVGCVFKAEHGHSASCVVVRDGERHIRQKARAKGQSNSRPIYSEADQLIPRNGSPVEFYENVGMNNTSGSDGAVRRALVPAHVFEVKGASSSEAGKTRSATGIDCTRRNTEKVKRVKLVDQFGKYMIGSLGRGGDDANADKGGSLNQSRQYIKFYQRLGNVGIWGFGDGAFQFNFPDHTKLVMHLPERRSRSSSYALSPCQMDFYHLSPSAARYLSAKGKMHPSGFDTRSVISDNASTFFSCLSGDGGQTHGISPERFRDILEANFFHEKVEFITTVLRSWMRNGRLGGRVVLPSSSPLTSISSSGSISSSAPGPLKTSSSSTSSYSTLTRSATLSSMPSTAPTSIPDTVDGDTQSDNNSTFDMFWGGTQERSWMGSSGGKFVWVTVGAQGGDGEYISVVLKGNSDDRSVQCVGAEGQEELRHRLQSLSI